jgi:hypothetical protein
MWEVLLGHQLCEGVRDVRMEGEILQRLRTILLHPQHHDEDAGRGGDARRVAGSMCAGWERAAQR